MKKFIVIASVILTGCANGYQQYFSRVDGATEELVNSVRAAPPADIPTLRHITIDAIKQIQDEMMKNGYRQFAYSSFTGGQNVNDQQAIAQARSVGADLVVVVNPTSAGTRTGVMPLSMPTTATAYTNTSNYGSATTTVYGSQMAMIPISVERFNYAALYFVKSRFTFGAYVENLSDLERTARGSNKGATIITVVNNTPAFDADFLVNDILISINGDAISTKENFLSTINKYRGENVIIEYVRNGVLGKKTVKLNL